MMHYCKFCRVHARQNPDKSIQALDVFPLKQLNVQCLIISYLNLKKAGAEYFGQPTCKKLKCLF